MSGYTLLGPAVHDLIHKRGKAIGSSMREPFGYFLAVTSEERQAAARLLRSRGIAMLVTAGKIAGIDRKQMLAEIQTELEDA